MSPALLTAAIVEYVGLRPIGWEAMATGMAALLGTGVFSALTFPAAVLATRRLPGLLGAVVALAVAWAPVVAAHVFVVMPWELKASYVASWPEDLAMSELSVCAGSFSASGVGSRGIRGRGRGADRASRLVGGVVDSRLPWRQTTAAPLGAAFMEHRSDATRSVI
jgi:hypothetical protein